MRCSSPSFVIPSSLQFYQTVGPRATGEDAGFGEKGAAHNAGEVLCQPQMLASSHLFFILLSSVNSLVRYFDTCSPRNLCTHVRFTQALWLLCTCVFAHIYAHTRMHTTCFYPRFIWSLQLESVISCHWDGLVFSALGVRRVNGQPWKVL